MSHAITTQLAQARAQLAPVAKENAALEARVLAAHAWRMSAEELIFYGHDTRDPVRLKTLIERRLTAEPIAQILGERHFWRDVFMVSRDVLTPRPDSETMIEALLRARVDHEVAYRLLDLGTGSGCLLLSALREYPNARGIGIDQSDAALAIAAHNAAALELSHRSRMLRSNWCSNIDGTFDIVLANPPYIPTDDIAALDVDVRGFEPHAALDGGMDGLKCYRDIITQLPQYLNAGAVMLFEVGQGQAADVAVLGMAAGWNVKEIAKDLAGISRVVVFENR